MTMTSITSFVRLRRRTSFGDDSVYRQSDATVFRIIPTKFWSLVATIPTDFGDSVSGFF